MLRRQIFIAALAGPAVAAEASAKAMTQPSARPVQARDEVQLFVRD